MDAMEGIPVLLAPIAPSSASSSAEGAIKLIEKITAPCVTAEHFEIA